MSSLDEIQMAAEHTRVISQELLERSKHLLAIVAKAREEIVSRQAPRVITPANVPEDLCGAFGSSENETVIGLVVRICRSKPIRWRPVSILEMHDVYIGRHPARDKAVVGREFTASVAPGIDGAIVDGWLFRNPHGSIGLTASALVRLQEKYG